MRFLVYEILIKIILFKLFIFVIIQIASLQ